MHLKANVPHIYKQLLLSVLLLNLSTSCWSWVDTVILCYLPSQYVFLHEIS